MSLSELNYSLSIGLFNLLVVAIIGLFQNLHDFDYRIKEIDFLSRRDSFIQQIFII